MAGKLMNYSESPEQQGQWYLVQCKAREGFKAEQHLKEQNFECFHPVHWRRKTVIGQKPKLQLESLFPFYLFLYAHPGQSLAAVRSTRGVLKMVAFGGQPLDVNPELVMQLQQYCASLAQPDPDITFKAGDKVRITDGPFAELEAIVKCPKANERVILLLNLLGRSTEVTLRQDQLTGR